MDHSVPGIGWVLTRLQCQFEALVNFLEKQHPGLESLLDQETDRLLEQGRMPEIGAETKREIDQVADWLWLKAQKIQPPPPF